MIKIIIACGSGIATSTLAADEVKSVCNEYGIKNIEVIKCSLAEIPAEDNDVDLILTTNHYQDECDNRFMSVINFVTGIGEDELRKKLGERLKEIERNT